MMPSFSLYLSSYLLIYILLWRYCTLCVCCTCVHVFGIHSDVVMPFSPKKNLAYLLQWSEMPWKWGMLLNSFVFLITCCAQSSCLPRCWGPAWWVFVLAFVSMISCIIISPIIFCVLLFDVFICEIRLFVEATGTEAELEIVMYWSRNSQCSSSNAETPSLERRDVVGQEGLSLYIIFPSLYAIFMLQLPSSLTLWSTNCDPPIQITALVQMPVNYSLVQDTVSSCSWWF